MAVLASPPGRIRAMLSDALYGGSFVLLVNTAVLSAFGLAFWTVAARMFTDQQVGAFTALVSGVNLLSTIAAVGVPNLLMRYLKNSDDQRRLVTGSLAAVGLVGGLAAVVALLVLGSLHLDVLRAVSGTWAVLLVVGFVVVSALSAAIDAGLVALSETVLLTKKNALGGALKVAFLFTGPVIGAAALPLAFALGAVVPVAIGAVALLALAHPGTGPSRLRSRGRFSAINYAGTLFGILPSTVVPLLVFSVAGAAPAAWFSVASLPVSFLNFVPSVVSQVYFAQASAHADKALLLRRAAKLVFGLLVPAVAVLVLAAPYVMAIFGHSYALHATWVVRGLAVSALCGAANYLIDSTVIAADRVVAYLVLNALNALLVLGFAAGFVSHGLAVMTLGLAAAQSLSLVIGLLYLRSRRSTV